MYSQMDGTNNMFFKDNVQRRRPRICVLTKEGKKFNKDLNLLV